MIALITLGQYAIGLGGLSILALTISRAARPVQTSAQQLIERVAAVEGAIAEIRTLAREVHSGHSILRAEMAGLRTDFRALARDVDTAELAALHGRPKS